MRRIWIALVACLLVLAGASPALAAHTPRDECSATFFHGDPRLGPQDLPTAGTIGRQLRRYHRTGRLSEPAFFATYYDAAASSWKYPPQNGYVIGPDGKAIEWHKTLRAGLRIDRYGSEYGSFLAPEGLPYASRSIPPQSLDSTPPAPCNYHDYRVVKAFKVDAGPIAPWFAQPGGGLQYQLDGSLVPGSPAALNVMWLIANGYLSRV